MDERIRQKIDELKELASETNTSILVIGVKEKEENEDTKILGVAFGSTLFLATTIASIITCEDDYEETKRISNILKMGVYGAREYEREKENETIN